MQFQSDSLECVSLIPTASIKNGGKEEKHFKTLDKLSIIFLSLQTQKSHDLLETHEVVQPMSF